MASKPPTSPPQTLLSSAGRAWSGVEAELVRVAPGKARVGGSELHTLGIHCGPPVNADCSCDGVRLKHVQKSGDIGFVPSGMDSVWEDDAECRLLKITLRPSLVQRIAEEVGRDPSTLCLIPHLHLRDPRIEAIGWAIKADLESTTPSDALYVDHLASALAIRLIESASEGRGRTEDVGRSQMSPRRLNRVIDFIEANLDRQIRLPELAKVAGLGLSQFKVSFRNSMGTSVHQYVIRRRVEYARSLLSTTTTPAGEIALVAGFSHQSHMTSTMRRVLGHVPSDIERPPSDGRPILIRPA